MSVIRRVPFIEKVLSKMDSAEKANLKHIVNTAGENKNCSLLNLPEKGVHAVYFQLDKSIFRTGILIYTDDHLEENETQCVLICYHRFQDLELFNINVENKSYRKIYEHCTIEEFRRALEDSINKESVSVSTDKTVEFAKDVEIDGELRVNSDFRLHGDFIVGDETVQLFGKPLSLFPSADGYESAEIFNSHVHISVEIDTNITHTGADFVLHPYDVVPCLVPFLVMGNGEYVYSHAYLTENGKVHIVVPPGIELTDIKAVYKIL